MANSLNVASMLLMFWPHLSCLKFSFILFHVQTIHSPHCILNDTFFLFCAFFTASVCALDKTFYITLFLKADRLVSAFLARCLNFQPPLRERWNLRLQKCIENLVFIWLSTFLVSRYWCLQGKQKKTWMVKLRSPMWIATGKQWCESWHTVLLLLT